MPTPSVAAIIPTLDEEATIRRCLRALLDAADEVVVADGGSRDATPRIAAEMGARVVAAPCGRGPQMNQGARQSSAAVLVFVHADSRLPGDALPAIRQEIAHGRVGGGFHVRFDDDRLIFRLGSRLVNLRTRFTGLPLGDQAQFVRRDAFEALRGFRDWPILEDLDFIRRLKRHGRIAIIRRPIVTSARRYVHGGILRTVANNWLIWCLFSLGVSPHRLAGRYRQIR